MRQYLYGASVQGIQDFIFKTNKLQEIVGASEIVKSVSCEFENTSGYEKGNKNILLNTAGNIKAIFEDKALLEKVVLTFSKTIQQSAYGITLSQAVVDMADPKFEKQQDAIDELETKLKEQRNKSSIPLDMSLNIMKLNPKTAKPLANNDEDRATQQKREAYVEFFADKPRLEEFKEFKDISNSKNKIAVIHIDGNGLGKLIPELGDKLSSFSTKLDEATKKAFEDARKDTMSIRDVVLGGDDVTVVCNANDALEFTKNFLKNFETNTSTIKELEGLTSKLTACAGIAYTNEKYPFHYAVSLAETLCGVAKKHSNRASSCLMFHNIQSSNFQSWDKFLEDELTIKNDTQKIGCDFGAYYLNSSDNPTIENLIIVTESLRLKDSPSSRLRSWLSELYKSDINAKNFLDRIDKIADEKPRFKKILNENFAKLHPKLKLNNLIVDSKTPIYDIFQILSTTTSYKGDTNDS